MKIVILGLAKTGTTGLFYKIKNSLGADTLCFFEPQKIEIDKLGNTKNVLVKELLWSKDRNYSIYPSFDKKILIVRDPRDYFISSLIYSSFFHGSFISKEVLSRVFSIIQQKENNSDLVSFMNLVEELKQSVSNKPDRLIMWKDQINRFMNFHRDHQDFFVFKYEDLVKQDFVKLEEYLGLKLSGSSDVDVSLSRVVRSKKSNNWKSWFTTQDVSYFQNYVKEFMMTYSYFCDWELNNDRSIPKAEASEYIIKLLKERVASGSSKDVTIPIIKSFFELKKINL